MHNFVKLVLNLIKTIHNEHSLMIFKYIRKFALHFANMVHYSWISLSKAAAPPHVQGFKPRHLAGSIIDQRQHKLS
jgi:hypothetical protein